MAGRMKPSAIAELTYGVIGRPANSSCKLFAYPASRWRSSFRLKLSRRSSALRLQCKARTVKHAEPLDATKLQERFGSENLQFSDVGGLIVIELKLNSGVEARLLLQEARITSYKCRLWHGSIEEFLHTDVLEEPTAASSTSSPQFLVTGGIVPYLAYPLPPHLPLVEDNWEIDWVQVDPDEQAQVTLKYVDKNQGSRDYTLQCVITLTKHYLASCVVISNGDSKPMTFTGSITTHLAIRSTEAICAAGLQGCKYYSPSEAARRHGKKTSSTTDTLFGRLKRFVLKEAVEEDQIEKAMLEGTSELQEQTSANPFDNQANWFSEKMDDVLYFTNGVHKVYSEASNKQIRLTDQGFRRSLLFESYGYGNLEISSPEDDGENPFVSIGCSSALSPITLNPQDVWRGAQILCPDT